MKGSRRGRETCQLCPLVEIFPFHGEERLLRPQNLIEQGKGKSGRKKIRKKKKKKEKRKREGKQEGEKKKIKTSAFQGKRATVDRLKC